MKEEPQTVKRPPLLYIAQPDLQPAFVKMQDYYTIKKEVPELDVENLETEPLSEVPDLETKEEEKTIPLRKKFHEYSIEEKIHFFTNRKSNMPKPLCEIITETETYQGRIVSLENNIVTARILKDPYKVQIPIRLIQSIQVIGL
ncbi:NADH:ubiquinone oxidoreductase subunit D [Bacillus mesophilus]|uniref:Spore coat protein CotO n=1 Tax=Bacillus mesophilus TaxID=1808955 RepID=A0A6M0Q305_9BACI|nr:CotO family spore coat protein [Bacillus mesophilus]MBM7659729.1 NADH:ubiquinone oxidoreductase subunit D [Bacillus mesophilus]NEY70592.1 hypothetical protein [Bacillus mesophilus]